MTASTPHAGAPVERVHHRAARFEDWLHRARERRARRRGQRPIVVPYTGYGSTEWVRLFCRVVLTKTEPAAAERPEQRIRGWRSFTSVHVAGAKVTIELDGQRFEVSADRGGVVDIRLDVALRPGWHTATLSAEHSVEVLAPIFVVDPATTFGLISDIDDTVMVTALPRPLLAAWNTFVLDEHARIPTPGIAVLYERLMAAHPGSPVIYLSTGAWNVAPTLSRFLSRNLFPRGPLLLTDWGPTHDRWFRSGREHKEANLARLQAEFPSIKWLLIGDDGQHDEEIYAEFAAQHPENVAAIAIRRLSTGEAVFAGGRSSAARDSVDVPWVSGNSGSELARGLTAAGLL
ncbi:MAG TPA: phosphatase domain-containing protein [Candidatus Lumbricidophila sp.]|nr:phosphatase domain-containing protein [Candidatus Lumbricidophila sp.]